MAGEKNSLRPSHTSAGKNPSRKLKHVKESAEDSKVANGEAQESARKDGKENIVGNGLDQSVDEGKKQKSSKRESKKRRLQEDKDGDVDMKENEEVESHKKKKTKKTKSVSFSADAKVNDAGEDEDATTPQSPVEETAAEADDEGGDASKKEKKKKKKDKKRKDDSHRSTNDASTAVPEVHEAPILSYLSLYHNDRSAWKFQKNRETHIFKHVLSLEHIPSRYNAALLSYLQGLKSEAAKQRLREVAGAAVKIDMEETQPDSSAENTEHVEGSEDQGTSPTAIYRKAVYAYRTRLSEGGLPDNVADLSETLEGDLVERFEKRQRAELVLFALDGRVFTMRKLKAPPQKGKAVAQNQTGQKKKKNRTAFIEISSSSESESESSSSSDSDSDSSSSSSSSSS